MASDMYLIEREEKILDVEKALTELEEALSFETTVKNRDCWGTIGVNVYALSIQANRLYRKIQEKPC